MNEQAFQFGPHKNLAGVLTTPSVEPVTEPSNPSSGHQSERPVALILNAGIVHRSGPFRLHVDISRALAEHGFSSLRMDLSGLGDSAVRTEIAEGQNRAELDAGDAIDFLQSEFGADRVVVMGLCSGAYNGHQVAINDKRVVGGVFLDGLAYRTDGFYRRERIRKLTQVRSWRNAIKRRVVQDAMFDLDDNAPDASEFFEVDKPAQQVADEIQGMLNRQLQLLFIYTQGYEDVSSRDQFQEMFGLTPNDEQLQVDYFDNFEHTFPIAAHRKTIVKRIAQWCCDRFPHSRRSSSDQRELAVT